MPPCATTHQIERLGCAFWRIYPLLEGTDQSHALECPAVVEEKGGFSQQADAIFRIPGAPNAPGIVPQPTTTSETREPMATPRKGLPTAARIAVRDATDAATRAAARIRQVRRAQTATAPGDRDLADALTELERILRLLAEALTGGSMEDKGRPVPSVGRMVHYKAYGTPGGEFPAGVCRAAVITEVSDPGDPESAIGLCVLNPTGQFFNRDVPFGDAPGQWHWPEFVPPVKGGSA